MEDKKNFMTLISILNDVELNKLIEAWQNTLRLDVVITIKKYSVIQEVTMQGDEVDIYLLMDKVGISRDLDYIKRGMYKTNK